MPRPTKTAVEIRTTVIRTTDPGQVSEGPGMEFDFDFSQHEVALFTGPLR